MADSFFRATQAASALVEKLRLQNETFGLSSIQAEIFKLRQDGASDAILIEAAALEKQIKAIEESKKVQDDLANKAKSIFSGLIDEETFDRAVKAAKGSLSSDGLKLAGVAAFGSDAARTAILHNRNIGQKPIQGKEASDPVLLDSSGQQLAANGTPVFIDFEVYFKANFGAFNLPV